MRPARLLCPNESKIPQGGVTTLLAKSVAILDQACQASSLHLLLFESMPSNLDRSKRHQKMHPACSAKLSAHRCVIWNAGFEMEEATSVVITWAKTLCVLIAFQPIEIVVLLTSDACCDRRHG